MPFIPHTEADTRQMLKAVGMRQIDDLFAEIPEAIRAKPLEHIPEALSEMALMRLMQARAKQDEIPLQFMGAGAYEHHIPAAIWDIATRGEWMTAYTPYQAEASQGTLQLLYEYQTMMANLTRMEVSNASLYDGASALSEAVLMAVRSHKNIAKDKPARILVPQTLHPAYRAALESTVRWQNIELIDLPVSGDGHIDIAEIKNLPEDFTALIIPYPNFFGIIEEADLLTNWAHEHNALVIAATNPLALALLKPPGEWGEKGADIVVGELQPFGIPLASGGPYAGFMCCKQAYLRQMPGRLVGATIDKSGKRGFTLTLQAREQHIRRAKATSNICTNQGLLITAASMYMSLLGPHGLQRVAEQCHAMTNLLLQELTSLPGVTRVFSRPFFHEIVLHVPDLRAKNIPEKLAEQGILAGYVLENLENKKDCLLICATETKTPHDIYLYKKLLGELL